jgi:hypothetical protein
VGISNPNAQEVSVQLPCDPANGGDQGGGPHGGKADTGSGSMPAVEALTGVTGNSNAPSAPGTNTGIEAALNPSGEPIQDNDLHGAVVSITCDALLDVDYTLDQLISSTDLFDVPAMDLSGDLPT